MLSYSTIPADEVQQPVKGASWKRVVVVAATASFVLGTVVLRSATPLTTALHSGGGESGGEVETVTVDTDTDPCGHQMDAFFKCTKPFPTLWDGDVFSTMGGPTGVPQFPVDWSNGKKRTCADIETDSSGWPIQIGGGFNILFFNEQKNKKIVADKVKPRVFT